MTAPGRAAICTCCARPTGEFHGGDRDVSPFCEDCRDLPAPWQVRGNRTEVDGTMINTTDPGYQLDPDYDVDTGQVTAVGGRRGRNAFDPLPTPAPQPVMEDDEDEPHDVPTCAHCGGTEFFAVYHPAGRIWRRGNTEENEHGDRTIYVDHYDDDTYADELDKVECAGCGREFRDFDQVEYI